jgi:hypothetical protein
VTTTSDEPSSSGPPPEPAPISDPRGKRALWAAVLGTPALFILHLTVTYAVVPVLCYYRKGWVLHVITGVFLVLAAIAVGVAGREWSRLASRKAAPGDDVDELGRAQFLAVLGTMTATFFFVVILAAGIPPFFIGPCQD